MRLLTKERSPGSLPGPEAELSRDAARRLESNGLVDSQQESDLAEPDLDESPRGYPEQLGEVAYRRELIEKDFLHQIVTVMPG